MISHHFWFELMYEGVLLFVLCLWIAKNISINVIGHDNLQKIKLLGSSG